MLGLRKVFIISLALAASSLTASPGGAQDGPSKPARLATDPTMDAPPSQDLTFLDVARTGNDLEIRIGISGIVPVLRGADPAGVQWTFQVRGTTYVAEAFAQAGDPGFILFRVNGDRFEQLAQLEGTYDEADGFARMLVPLSKIKAKPGTRISGIGSTGTEDVDFHLHLGPRTEYTDKMATTKDFVVPKR